MEYDAYDPTLPSRREDAPEDHKNVAYWSCVALGAGILFPWNAWITAVDYFEMTYPGRHVDRVFPVLYFFPNVCALLVVLKHGHRLSQRARVRGGFVVFLLCLLAPAFASFAVVCVAVALTGAADAFAQGSLFGVVAPMPPSHTQALMAGTSVSGLVIATLRLTTRAAFGEANVRTAAGAYFGVAAAWVLACVALHGVLERTEMYAYYTREKDGGGDYVTVEEADEEADETRRALAPGGPSSSSGVGGGGAGGNRSSRGVGVREARDVLRRAWPQAVSVYAVYAVTLSIFPGVLAEDVSSAKLGSWYPLVLIACFNLFDVVGKAAPALAPALAARAGGDARALLTLALTRVLFVPAFVCVSARRGFEALSANELPCVLLVMALGWTNGWVGAVAMMAAPEAAEASRREACGTVMVLFLLSGLTTGAFCGWLWLL
jgi:equilibrative nucleoside transporter 1/2/3